MNIDHLAELRKENKLLRIIKRIEEQRKEAERVG